MQANYRLEERALQAGNSGGTQKSAERCKPHIDTAAMVSALLRRASLNPKMTAAIEGETEPCLTGLLARKGVRNG